MAQNDNIQLFEDKRIRTAWDEEKEEWYFSIVDVVAVLTDQPDQRHAAKYWSVLKARLKKEGSELTTNCSQLKMRSADGKRYNTDVADTEQLLRIIQSIPSPKAEPFKLWLAQVGRERIEETIDPELTIDRALETYLKKGYSREWINQRLQAIQVRKELTDEWDARGVQKGVEYAILTDEISRAWSGMSTRQYKNLKGLKKENLRDNMTTLELVLNMLAEATTTQFSRDRKPTTFQENLAVAKAGGQVAGRTRKDIESQSDTPVITSKNAAQLNQVVTDLLEGAEHHPCFELFYRNTGGFLFGKPCDTRLPLFCVWLMCIGKHQNCEDVFIRRHRYMNTAFRYSYFDMLLQTLAVSCISAFDGGEPHCKNGYTHPRFFESAFQKYIHAGRSPLF